jgi:FKBP-type peptidyl-prolyl cis-trans isomerase
MYPAYPADSITVTYSLKLLPSEALVQSSSTPVKFLLGDLILGWQLGLPLINEASKATLYIPSGLGYGSTGSNSIPANANLIYEIQLLNVVPQLKKDTVAINSFLKTNNISSVITDPSGLKYVITSLGTGTKPTLNSSITFSYTGKLLSSGVIFGKSSSPASETLKNLIKGFQLGMLQLPSGSKATFYMPSVLGYGLNSSQTIPRNSNLIFDVELVSVN